MQEVFYEVLLAPGYEPGALEILQKKRNLRILTVKPQPPELNEYSFDYRIISGGFLVQTQDNIIEDFAQWECVTRRKPNPSEYEDLVFAWKAARHIKSNAIVFAKDKTLTGMGAGQPNRVVSVHLSERVAGEKAPGSVLASDAFFPFPDNIELAAAAGITAVIQPGGSIRDEEVINAANQSNLAMLFTGTRHFKH
jgi:AICAR transformylase/IMP cyclohydrolase PurH (only IMP cyclohydrolase domain in Aful)